MIEAKNEKELGDAIKHGEDFIEIEIDLYKKIIKIKNVKNMTVVIVGVAAALAAGATGAATVLSAGTAAPAALVSSVTAIPAVGGTVAAIGVPATITAIGIASAGGGISALNKLRQYKVKKISDTKMVLYKD